MRMHLVLDCKEKYYDEYITLEDSTGREFNLSFTEHTECFDADDNSFHIYAKDEETYTYGNELDIKIGNNEETNNFLKNAKVTRVCLVPLNDDEKIEKDIKVLYIAVLAGGEKYIELELDDNIVIE